MVLSVLFIFSVVLLLFRIGCDPYEHQHCQEALWEAGGGTVLKVGCRYPPHERAQPAQEINLKPRDIYIDYVKGEWIEQEQQIFSRLMEVCFGCPRWGSGRLHHSSTFILHHHHFTQLIKNGSWIHCLWTFHPHLQGILLPSIPPPHFFTSFFPLSALPCTLFFTFNKIFDSLNPLSFRQNRNLAFRELNSAVCHTRISSSGYLRRNEKRSLITHLGIHLSTKSDEFALSTRQKPWSVWQEWCSGQGAKEGHSRDLQA